MLETSWFKQLNYYALEPLARVERDALFRVQAEGA